MARFTKTGNEVEVYLAGIKADLLQNVSGGDDYGPQEVSGVGDIHVLEYPPSMARHNISIDKMMLRKERLVAAGVIPENGDVALQGAIFDIEIFSKENGRLLKKWSGCSCASARVNVVAHRVIVEDANFVATDTSGGLGDLV